MILQNHCPRKSFIDTFRNAKVSLSSIFIFIFIFKQCERIGKPPMVLKDIQIGPTQLPILLIFNKKFNKYFLFNFFYDKKCQMDRYFYLFIFFTNLIS